MAGLFEFLGNLTGMNTPDEGYEAFTRENPGASHHAYIDSLAAEISGHEEFDHRHPNNPHYEQYVYDTTKAKLQLEKKSKEVQDRVIERLKKEGY